MNFSIRNYYKPTPAKIRKIADSFVAASLFVSGWAAWDSYSTIAIVAVSIGAIAKFFSNFYSEDST